MFRIRILMVASTVACLVGAAQATVTEFQNKTQWVAQAEPYVTIDFIGFPNNTLITTQYSALGVIFTDNSDYIHFSNSFPNDGRGLNGAFDEIALSFAHPMSSIAVEFPGLVQFELYNAGRLIYTSSAMSQGFKGNFGGLISTEPFDSAIILDPSGGVFIDDLHFGPPIPAPGALGLLALTLFALPRRRRSNYRY